VRDRVDLELNMTPMIDVVFNLLVFFMIALDLSQKDLEELALPTALCSVEDRGEERVTVNVVKAEDHADTGAVRIVVRGRDYDLEGLGDLLFAMAERHREDAPGPNPPSDIPVLVRCDREVRWRAVQRVLQVCAKPPVRIWKVEFATAKLR
jgi:biopolymer transport protein ExbD